MKKSTIFWGGIKIGHLRASFPLAQLQISQDKLIIRLLFYQVYSFTNNKILAFEKEELSVVVKSIYSKDINFWCINPNKVINEIKIFGFYPCAVKKDILISDGRPIKKYVSLIYFLIWISLFFIDRIINIKNGLFSNIGFFGHLAIVIVLLSLFLFLKFKFIQRIILKPNRTIDEIKPEIISNLIIFIIIFIIILISYL